MSISSSYEALWDIIVTFPLDYSPVFSSAASFFL